MSTELRQLSDREIEILRLVATGLSNQQIANSLGVSVNTVKVHLRNVFGKIDVASRTEATMYAVRTGIVTVDTPQRPAAIDTDVEGPAQHITFVVEPYVPAPSQPEQAEPEIDRDPSPLNEPVADEVADDHAVSLPPAPPVTPARAPQTETITETTSARTIAQSAARRRWLSIWALPVAGLAVVGVVVSLLAQVWPIRSGQNTPEQNETSLATDLARWKGGPDIPTPRAAFAIAYGGQLVYVAGGENQTGVLNTLERYDVRLGSWTALSRKPTAVTDVQAAMLGGKLYVPGGRRSSDSKSVSDVFERYDPRTETWEKLPSLPQPRSAYALATLEGKLYVFGGWDGTTYRREVFEYDPDRASWQERPQMPTGRAFATAATVEDGIYVLGGENERGQLTSNEVYSPDQGGDQVWARRAPMPQPRSRFGVGVGLALIHVAGGAPANAPPLKYNTRTDNWQTFAAPPHPIGGQPGVLLVDGMLICLGGKLDNDRYATTMQMYQALYSVNLPHQ
jgi:DNA-binding CsgD family transcriptional regulator/outer membrane protein assembly factor BamB